jgi:hypothetical protein
LAFGCITVTLFFAATPAANLWLTRVMAVPEDILGISRTGLWIALLIPFFTLIQNFYQGIIVSTHKTRGVTEAVFIYIVSIGIVLFIGVQIKEYIGLFVTLIAYEFAGFAQAVWLWFRSRSVIRTLSQNNQHLISSS